MVILAKQEVPVRKVHKAAWVQEATLDLEEIQAPEGILEFKVCKVPPDRTVTRDSKDHRDKLVLRVLRDRMGQPVTLDRLVLEAILVLQETKVSQEIQVLQGRLVLQDHLVLGASLV